MKITDVKHDEAREHLPKLCREVRMTADEIAALKERKKELMDEVGRLAGSANLHNADGGVRGDGWLLLKVAGQRASISADKLRELGVSDDVIEAATETRSWNRWQVRKGRALATEEVAA